MKAVVDRKLTVRGASAEVLVGGARVTVYFSNWSGLETYSVDGKELLRVRSFSFSGTREIPLPDGRTLFVEVIFPVSRLVLDGTPVVENLFPHQRTLWRITKVLAAVTVVLGAWVAWLLYLATHRPSGG